MDKKIKYIIVAIISIVFIIFVIIKLGEIASLNWKSDYLEDEFGDKSDIKCIINLTKVGSFSNSIVENGALSVDVIFTKKPPLAGFLMREHGYPSAPTKLTGHTIIRLKNSNGETLELQTYLFHPKLGMVVESFEYYELVNFFKKSSGDVKVVIIDKDSDKYTFSVNVTKFSKAYDELMKEAE